MIKLNPIPKKSLFLFSDVVDLYNEIPPTKPKNSTSTPKITKCILVPLINQTDYFFEIIGVLILFIGLSGGILLYKSTTSKKRTGIFLGAGFGLMVISLLLILEVARRI